LILVPCIVVVTLGNQEITETMKVTSMIFFLTFNLFTDEVLASHFEAVTSSSGEKQCAIDKPSDTVMNVRSDIQCGAICMADELCETYSFKKDLKQCDLYDCTAPHNYSAVPGCSSYKLQGKLYCMHSNATLRIKRHVYGVDC